MTLTLSTNAVIALVCYEVRGGGSGIALDGDQAWAFWLRDGRIYGVDQHAKEEEDALAAVGLSE